MTQLAHAAMKQDAVLEQKAYNQLVSDVETATIAQAEEADQASTWSSIGQFLLPLIAAPFTGGLSLAGQAGVAALSSWFGGKTGQWMADFKTKAEHLGIDTADYIPEGRVGGGDDWYWGIEGVESLNRSIDKINQQIDKAGDDLNRTINETAFKDFGMSIATSGLAELAKLDVDEDLIFDKTSNQWVPNPDAVADKKWGAGGWDPNPEKLGFFEKLFEGNLVEKAAATSGIQQYILDPNAGWIINPEYQKYAAGLKLGDKSDLLSQIGKAYNVATTQQQSNIGN